MLKLVSALLHFICVIQQSPVCIAEWSNVTEQWAAHYSGAKTRPIFIIRNGLALPSCVIKTTNSNTATGNGIIGPKLLGNFLRLRDREGSCRVRHQRRGNTVFTISRDNDGNLVLIWPDPDPVRCSHYKKVAVLLVFCIIMPGHLYTLPSRHPANTRDQICVNKCQTHIILYTLKMPAKQNQTQGTVPACLNTLNRQHF